MTATTFGDLDGLYKEAYADGGVVNLIPEGNHLQQAVKMMKGKQQIGNVFHQPVKVAGEQGFTYAAPNGGFVTSNTPISEQMQDIQVVGGQVSLESGLTYEAAARSVASVNAFMDATEAVFEDMNQQYRKRVELGLLYGQTGIGRGDSSVNINATSTTVTFTVGHWAAGIWSGLENAQVQFWDLSNVLVSTGADSVFTVGVSASTATTGTVVFTGTATGITALDIALAAGDCDIYFNGARTAAAAWSEAAGINRIMTNTGSLFNVDAAVYSLWRSNTYDAAGTLSKAKVDAAIARAVDRGLAKNATVYLNPNVWNSLSSEMSAFRQFDSSYSSADGKNGFKKLTLYSQNGTVEIVPHLLVKTGDAFVLPLDSFKRVGAVDMTFNLPGSGDKIFFHNPTTLGYTMRAYGLQGAYIEKPAQCTKVFGITLA